MQLLRNAQVDNDTHPIGSAEWAEPHVTAVARDILTVEQSESAM